MIQIDRELMEIRTRAEARLRELKERVEELEKLRQAALVEAQETVNRIKKLDVVLPKEATRTMYKPSGEPVQVPVPVNTRIRRMVSGYRATEVKAAIEDILRKKKPYCLGPGAIQKALLEEYNIGQLWSNPYHAVLNYLSMMVREDRINRPSEGMYTYKSA